MMVLTVSWSLLNKVAMTTQLLQSSVQPNMEWGINRTQYFHWLLLAFSLASVKFFIWFAKVRISTKLTRELSSSTAFSDCAATDKSAQTITGWSITGYMKTDLARTRMHARTHARDAHTHSLTHSHTHTNIPAQHWASNSLTVTTSGRGWEEYSALISSQQCNSCSFTSPTLDKSPQSYH